MENKSQEILLGLTTTPGSDWRGKVEEMNKFDIKKIALFPTFLKIEQRKELYDLLEKIDGLQIPHVHLRNDMEKWELEMFIKKYNTKVFNIHEQHFEAYSKNPFVQYLGMIFIENRFHEINSEYLDKCGGLCVDFSHLENTRIKKSSSYAKVMDLMNNYEIGCCHVSAIKGTLSWTRLFNRGGRDWHKLFKMKDVDYMKKYLKYLPKYVSLELENSFREQLKVRKYINDNILNK